MSDYDYDYEIEDEPPRNSSKSTSKKSSKNKPKGSQKSSRKSSSSKRKQSEIDEDQMYEQPDWSFPQEILDEKYDIKPLYDEVQKEFALSALRNQI